MFHVNEANKGRGVLIVQDGRMLFHFSASGKNILNLYLGKAEDAENNPSAWILHTEDMVTYEDGFSEKVYGFTVPVKKLDEEFDLALIGKKGTWYNHKVSVTDVSKIIEK